MRRITAVIALSLLLGTIGAPTVVAILDTHEVTALNVKDQRLALDVRVNVHDGQHNFTVIATFGSEILTDSTYVIGGTLDIPGYASTPVMKEQVGDCLTWHFSVNGRVLKRSIFRIGAGVRGMPGGDIWNVQLASFVTGRHASGSVETVAALLVAGVLLTTTVVVLQRRQRGRPSVNAKGAA